MNELIFYKSTENAIDHEPVYIFNNKITWVPIISYSNNLIKLTTPLWNLDTQAIGQNATVTLTLQKILESDLVDFRTILKENWYNLKAYYKIDWNNWLGPLNNLKDSIVEIISVDYQKYQYINNREDCFLDLTVDITPKNPTY